MKTINSNNLSQRTSAVLRTCLVLLAIMLLPHCFTTRAAAQNQPFVKYENGTLTFDYGEKPTGDDVYDITVDYPTANPAWYSKNASVTKVVFTPAFSNARPTTMSYWFKDCTNLTAIEGMEHLNTSMVNHFFYTFSGCEKLEYIDVSHFDTSNALIFGGMFQGCESLKSLDVSNFKTEKAAFVVGMFSGCKSLTSLDLRYFDMRNVTNMNSMFSGCTNLKSIYVDADLFQFPKLQENWAQGVFSGCESLEGASHYDVSKPLDPEHDQRKYLNYTTGYLQKIVGYQGNEPIGAAGDPLKIIDLTLKDKTMFGLTDNTVVGAKRASYSRDVTSDWGTICLPFPIDVTDEANDCWFYPLTEVQLTEGRIPVKKMTEGTIAAGVPMFIKRKDPNQATIHIIGKQTDDYVDMVSEPQNATSGDRLVGTFFATAAPNADNAYFIAKDKFRSVARYTGKDNAKGVKVYGYRAYIMTDENSSATAPAALSMYEYGGTTGITAPEATADDTTPTEYYDLQGRRTDGLHKGVNIVKAGGKVRKVIVE